MQITAIRNRFMRVPRQNWHFVEIETDNGIVGVGEASLEWREPAVATAVDELALLLIGAALYALCRDLRVRQAFC